MELSPFQRLAAFVAAVLILAGMGVYLFLPRAAAGGTGQTTSGRGGAPGPRNSVSQEAGAGSVHSATPGPASANPAGTPAATIPGGTGGAPNIYQWLPFTQAGLARAAEVTLKFAADYGTFSYTESTAGYLAPLRPLTTIQLADLLGRAYATPGLAASRAGGKQVSSASAAILELRGYGPASLTFVVSITERITSSKGGSSQTARYAITLTGGGTSWQVSDLELASAGNQ